MSKRKLKNLLKALSPEDKVDIVVEELQEKIEKVVEKVQSIKVKDGDDGEDGRDGKDADEEKIIKKVLAQIPKPKDGEKGEPGKDAEVDVAKLKTEIAAANTDIVLS